MSNPHTSAPETATRPLVEVKNLRVVLPLIEGNLTAADGVSFTIPEGKTLGLVGESGCGKTITAQSILKIAPRNSRTSGEILLHYPDRAPVDIVSLGPKDGELLSIRGGEAAMIFQEPMTSFSPVHSIGNQLLETIYLHRTRDKAKAHEIAVAMLQKVGIADPAAALRKYPHEFSGGMRQRAMIAMALASQPRLLIADEPTTALDLNIQKQIVDLLMRLKEDTGMALILITHDMGVVAETADRVQVQYKGRKMEEADVLSLFENPQNPYTRALLSALPENATGDRLPTVASFMDSEVPA